MHDSDRPPAEHTPAWRNFKRMQLSASLFGALIYALAVVHAYEVLPGEPRLKIFVFILAPASFFSMTLAAVFLAGPIRRWLKRYVWMTFAAGFGQTPLSVVVGLGILALAAGAIFYQIATHEEGAYTRPASSRPMPPAWPCWWRRRPCAARWSAIRTSAD
jgi:hypothetical protein